VPSDSSHAVIEALEVRNNAGIGALIKQEPHVLAIDALSAFRRERR
jgi:hypothetical protein